MRKLTGIIVVVAFLASLSLATETASSLEALLQMRAQASGAIDTVLNLLEDLRKSSLNEKADLEKRNKTQENDGTKLVAELTGILSMAQKNYDDAVAHRTFIEKEIEDTEAHLLWIENRLVEIHRKLAELKVQRCHANAMFVDALKQHNDALKAIKILQEEIKRLHAAGELTEISSLTEKFQAYEHLFEKESIQQFLDLSNERPVDEITGQVDNKKGALKREGMSTNPGQRNLKGNLADKVLQLLTNLAEHLKKSMKNLSKHEIQAAYDYADFKASSEIENVTLREDHVRKEKYIVKLEIDVEVARENEEKTLELRDESQLNLDSAVADLETKRQFYALESARIAEDIQTIENVIVIFKERVMTLQDELKQRVDQDQAGDKMTGFSRRVNEYKAEHSGKIGKEVAAEAAKKK